MSESDFTLDQIMHQYIKFHKLALTSGSSYIVLSEWIAKKKAVTKENSNGEECYNIMKTLRITSRKFDSSNIMKINTTGMCLSFH